MNPRPFARRVFTRRYLGALFPRRCRWEPRAAAGLTHGLVPRQTYGYIRAAPKIYNIAPGPQRSIGKILQNAVRADLVSALVRGGDEPRPVPRLTLSAW